MATKKKKQEIEIENWPDKPHFFEPELAKLAGVSVKTLWRLRKLGEIGYRRLGKRVIYTRADWEEYLRNSQHLPMAYATAGLLQRAN